MNKRRVVCSAVIALLLLLLLCALVFLNLVVVENQYLAAENRILREQIKGRWSWVTRVREAAKGF